MPKTIHYTALIAALTLLALGIWRWLDTPAAQPQREPAPAPTTLPSHVAAEQTGVQFMRDVINLVSNEDNTTLAARLYRTLSADAQQSVDPDAIARELATFVGIQNVPTSGVSVEDLQIHSSTSASVILGLNDPGHQTIRAVDIVWESGTWKVAEVRKLATYPPEPPELSVPSTTPVSSESAATNTPPTEPSACYVGGCSGQVCSRTPDVVTTCEWRDEYACYRDATCARGPNGQCGWVPTDRLQRCLAEAASGRSQ